MSPPTRNQVISVPKRRPPSPHSCSRSRSPARQRDAAKPSQVTAANSSTKMVRAVQLTSATAFPQVSHWRYLRPRVCARHILRCALRLFSRREVDDHSENCADENPDQLVPIEERQADQRRLGP